MNLSESETAAPDASSELSRGALFFRLAVMGVIIAGMAGSFAYAGGWLTPRALTPSAMIDTFEKANGSHPGFRRNHAKGVCVTGYFESNGQGAALSKSSVFQPGRVSVIGRFALAGGQPYAADAGHDVRSMALLFELPGGEEWRTGMNDIPVFPVNSAQGFHDLLLAGMPDPTTGKPDPAKMSAFLTQHPESAKALQLIRAYPVSSGFENTTYNSLNAFCFTNDKGGTIAVRWSMTPVQPFVLLGDEQTGQEKNYLFDDFIAKIKGGPQQWHLIITLAQPHDPTDDATLPWPPDRMQVDVGMLTIDHVESEDTSPARDINFDPLVLPVGMAGSDDPLLSARSAAYAESFTRREGEHKDPSAVSPAETGK